jgi:hypothetical protein
MHALTAAPTAPTTTTSKTSSSLVVELEYSCTAGTTAAKGQCLSLRHVPSGVTYMFTAYTDPVPFDVERFP